MLHGFFKVVANKFLVRSKKKIIILAVFFVLKLATFVYISFFLFPTAPLVNFDREWYNLIYDDTRVNTSSYLHDHNSLVQRYKPLKTQLDRINSKIKIQLPNRRVIKTKKEFLILEYTKVIGVEKYCHHYKHDKNLNSLNDEYAKKQLFVDECPYKNCKYTCDMVQVNKADMLIFHEGDLKKELSQNDQYLSQLNSKVPDRSSQIWLLYNDEANKVPEYLDKFKFNWTMTYRLDAEVSDCSYGCIYSKGTKSSNYHEQDLITRKTFLLEIQKEFNKRSNLAIWFVSNCDSKFRMNFASELKTHYPLKVIGSCAKYIHSAHESWAVNFFKNLIQPDCTRISECESIEFSQAKFYLAFESKNCSNYMTEKIWRILRTNLIPVVVQPSKKFYELNLPPNSYIHAADFDYDPKKLAEYLKKVSSDFDLYFKHLEWKLAYEAVYSGPVVERRRNCELCTKLNTEQSIIYYESVSKWFNYNCEVN